MWLTMLLDAHSGASSAPVSGADAVADGNPVTDSTAIAEDHSGTANPAIAANPDVSGGSTNDNVAFTELMSGLLPCRTSDPELWFAEQATGIEQAKALCRQCPLMMACLQGALDRAEPWGVWGGQVFVDGRVAATKRGRGRPRKHPVPETRLA